MKGNTSSLAFTSLAHFANDGSALFYPILITYYVQLPGMTISYLGVMAILFNLVSGALSTPIGKRAHHKHMARTQEQHSDLFP